MNLKRELNENEIKLIERAGVYIEDKNYDEKEMEKCAFKIQDYIISQSSKETNRISNEYRSIFDKLI